MEKFPITAKGYEQLLEEIKHLRSVERPLVIQAIASARELGDLSENAEYHAAREKQGFLEGRIMDLEDKCARAEIIDPTKLSGDTIKFG
ncbi:MAG: transcription elongation factor GreA, partial [Pseudomonadota bacterium]